MLHLWRTYPFLFDPYVVLRLPRPSYLICFTVSQNTMESALVYLFSTHPSVRLCGIRSSLHFRICYLQTPKSAMSILLSPVKDALNPSPLAPIDATIISAIGKTNESTTYHRQQGFAHPNPRFVVLATYKSAAAVLRFTP